MPQRERTFYMRASGNKRQRALLGVFVTLRRRAEAITAMTNLAAPDGVVALRVTELAAWDSEIHACLTVLGANVSGFPAERRCRNANCQIIFTASGKKRFCCRNCKMAEFKRQERAVDRVAELRNRIDGIFATATIARIELRLERCTQARRRSDSTLLVTSTSTCFDSVSAMLRQYDTPDHPLHVERLI